MTVTLILIAALATVSGVWLLRHGIMTSPWLETGLPEEAHTAPLPAAKIGLAVFIAVAATLMVLLLSAYSMRMQMADWSPPPRPMLLWVNSGVLVVASIALHRAARAAKGGDRAEVGSWLIAGGAAGLVFVVGQLLAWRELAIAGYLPAGNPADAFFYLITAVHGLHVLGGLAAIGLAAAKLRDGVRSERLRLSVELCATYWHFLLVAWLVLFGTLAFSPSFDWLVALCTAPFR